MQESYEEDLANHFGLDPYADAGCHCWLARQCLKENRFSGDTPCINEVAATFSLDST